LGFDTAVGVPDSTFKGLISYFSTQNIFKHVIATNECEAMGIAAGYYLARQKPALVYMQNSGFCKTLNPYISMLSPDVYSIPALLLVGWRGEPGQHDEPQHKMMGRVMMDLFKAVEIKHSILDETKWQHQLDMIREYFSHHSRPYILVIEKNRFGDFKIPPQEKAQPVMTREEALNIIVNHTSGQAVFISTTGKTSRELFEIREQRGETHGSDFYMVGSMGCASAVAIGVGLADTRKKVFILDGDGAALMQMGTMATIGHYKNPRLKHLILDNNSHESTGGQPTVSETVDFEKIGHACGYEYVEYVDNPASLRECVSHLEDNEKLSLVVVKIKKGSRSDLGRPTATPQENRDAFIDCFRQ
jgi:phosphonopyruvate decarboxylase